MPYNALKNDTNATVGGAENKTIKDGDIAL